MECGTLHFRRGWAGSAVEPGYAENLFGYAFWFSFYDYDMQIKELTLVGNINHTILSDSNR